MIINFCAFTAIFYCYILLLYFTNIFIYIFVSLEYYLWDMIYPLNLFSYFYISYYFFSFPILNYNLFDEFSFKLDHFNSTLKLEQKPGRYKWKKNS